MIGAIRRAPALGLAAISMALVGALIVPAGLRVRALGAEIARAEAELARPNSGPEVITKLESRLESLGELTRDTMSPIPADADVAQLISSLSGMLDELGLDRREITTGANREHAEASSLPMSVFLEGPFPAIAEAVRRIESLPRLIRVQRLRVEARQPRKGPLEHDVDVRADVLLEVFFDPKELADAGGGAS